MNLTHERAITFLFVSFHRRLLNNLHGLAGLCIGICFATNLSKPETFDTFDTGMRASVKAASELLFYLLGTRYCT